jgi:hypothetical protein
VPQRLLAAALELQLTLPPRLVHLVALGARPVQLLEADGINDVCIVMQDPEGNEFCLD